jgi:hypothetical protein
MKNIERSLIINLFIVVVCVILFKSVSYSANDKPNEANKNLLIETGNMQVVLNIPSDKYDLINEDGYEFSVKNTGNIPIEYYEIRVVDQENKISTMPHSYVDFSITKDNKSDNTIKNLGDNDSIIYSGYDLMVGKSVNFNLKMWIMDNEINALGKKLYGAIEVTLYQKYDVYKNYVLYDGNGGGNVAVRTSIYNPITTTIPKKEGYKFVGWKSMDNIIYYPGDAYNKDIGETLYAFWEKA